MVISGTNLRVGNRKSKWPLNTFKIVLLKYVSVRSVFVTAIYFYLYSRSKLSGRGSKLSRCKMWKWDWDSGPYGSQIKFNFVRLLSEKLDRTNKVRVPILISAVWTDQNSLDRFYLSKKVSLLFFIWSEDLGGN